MSVSRVLFICIFMMVAAMNVVAWQLCSYFAGPFPGAVSDSHIDLPVEYVDFKSKSGVDLKGSLLKGESGRGVVLLLHGHMVNRNILARRARFLSREKYTVFMFDFQAHGLSGGDFATLGYLESYDVAAAMDLLRTRFPDEKIAIVATSMGAASVMARGTAVDADAYVIECMYFSQPLIIERRIAELSGKFLARIFTPLVLWQDQVRFGFDPWAVVPADAVSTIQNPVLYMAAEQDQYVTLDESMEIYNRIKAPKEMWVIKGHPHGDFSHTVPKEYEQKVLQFLKFYLRSEKQVD